MTGAVLKVLARGAAAASGERRNRMPVCAVPGDEQLIAQQRRAAATSGVSCRARAFAQQSMPSFIPGMLHSCSPECSGMPATALMPSAANRNEDASHFTTTEAILLNGLKVSQGGGGV